MNLEKYNKDMEEEYYDFGALFSFPHTAVNAKAEIPQRDGYPMLYNGMYVTEEIKSFIKSSHKSLLKKIAEEEVEILKDPSMTKEKYISYLEEQIKLL